MDVIVLIFFYKDYDKRYCRLHAFYVLHLMKIAITFTALKIDKITRTIMDYIPQIVNETIMETLMGIWNQIYNIVNEYLR